MGASTDVIMPVLGMSQDSGRLIRWLVKAGERVEKGSPLMEVETDKAAVEIESPASGILTQVAYKAGDDVPVTQVMAVIVEDVSVSAAVAPAEISPLARRMAEEHNIDLRGVNPHGGRIEKADILAYLDTSKAAAAATGRGGIVPASPMARRLAQERGVDLARITGSGPQGEVLAEDVPAAAPVVEFSTARPQDPLPTPGPAALSSAQAVFADEPDELPVSAAWKRMVERISTSWPATPQFSLMREVDASRLIAWREQAQGQTGVKISYTDLLVKLAAMTLLRHPRVCASFRDGKLIPAGEVNIGLAVATDEELVVPVVHNADRLGLAEIAAKRLDLVQRAQARTLRPEDLQGGVFTISNLGMYGIDVFNAMVNPGQAAILAVGRIAERVVALNGQVVIRPMMTLSASFDHRIVDGARGALFLKTLGDWIEEPLGVLN